MAAAKFVTTKMGTVRSTSGHRWHLDRFGMVSRVHAGLMRFVSRDEVAKVLNAGKGRPKNTFTGVTYYSKTNVNSQSWEITRDNEGQGSIAFGCQTFSPAAVKALKAWAGAVRY